MLQEIVEANGGTFIRSGFIGFGPSSLDFELEFDVFDPDFEKVYLARHQIGLGILKKFNEAGLEFAYPTQTTFTAAPDGQMIRSEEHTSELQSLMRISYAVFCLKKKTTQEKNH